MKPVETRPENPSAFGFTRGPWTALRILSRSARAALRSSLPPTARKWGVGTTPVFPAGSLAKGSIGLQCLVIIAGIAVLPLLGDDTDTHTDAGPTKETPSPTHRSAPWVAYSSTLASDTPGDPVTASETSGMYQGKFLRLGATAITHNLFGDTQSAFLVEAAYRRPENRDLRLYAYAAKDENGKLGFESKLRFSLARQGHPWLLLGMAKIEAQDLVSYGTLGFGQTLTKGGRISVVDGEDLDVNGSLWGLFREHLFFGGEIDTHHRILFWQAAQQRGRIDGPAYRLFINADTSRNIVSTKLTLAQDANTTRWYALGNADAAYFREDDALEAHSPLVVNNGINANRYRPPISETWRVNGGLGLLVTTLESPALDQYEVRSFMGFRGGHFIDIGPGIITPKGQDSQLTFNLGYAFHYESLGLDFYVAWRIVEGSENDQAVLQFSLGR